MAKLSAAQRGKIRRLSQARELAPDEEGGELNIVPFLDIIVNVLIFVLATVAVTFTTSIVTTPPGAGGKGVRDDQQKKVLGLTVLIVSEGFSLKAEGGNVRPGCDGLGEGIAIPKKAGEYDFAALQACAQTLKASAPEFEEESTAYLAPDREIDYSTLIRTMDALRNKATGGALFPDINFKVSR
jgi:biopolymer transport protein ExbD